MKTWKISIKYDKMSIYSNCYIICRDEGISLIYLGIAGHINRSKILFVQGLTSKSCLALSLIRTPSLSQEFSAIQPQGVGGVFGIVSGCFRTPEGIRVYRQVKTGRQMTYELN